MIYLPLGFSCFRLCCHWLICIKLIKASCTWNEWYNILDDQTLYGLSMNIYNYIIIYNYITYYIYTIEQCALLVTTIMALWQLVNLGTRCTVTNGRIALWSHQSAQTASSEQCISANSEHLSERLSTTYIYIVLITITMLHNQLQNCSHL